MPGAEEVLAAWEAGTTAGAAERTLLLHALARPAAGAAELSATAVGQRDAELFALRGALFGDRMEVVVECPDCGEKLEFEVGIAELLGGRPRHQPDPGGPPQPAEQPAHHIDAGAWAVDFRSPTAADLDAVSGLSDASLARKALLTRIVLRAERSGRKVEAAAAQADPAADVRLAMQCPECSQKISAELDIAEYLWRELDVWARAVLSDIHLLASCYGWTEDQILALSPRRRRYYVERCVDG
jgi:DNA-directed RNA polymerase subunit RPC12/RpoP